MYSFVYSNNIKFRLYRHLTFWIIWFTYFITIYSLRPGSSYIGYNSFLRYTIAETLILMSVDVLFCYSVVYLLLPRYLLKGRYILFFLFIAVFIFLDASVSYFFYLIFINPLRALFELPLWKEISFPQLLIGMSSVLMITGIATTIKFLKLWYLKEQELTLLKSEKLTAELKFIDSYIQPSFVPLLLKKVYSFSVAASHKVPEMLSCMQKILTYLIDECTQSTVPIKHELEAIKDFLTLETLTNSGRLSINYEMNFDPGSKRIVPFILFPLIENNFRQVNDNISDKQWVNIVFALNDSTLKLEIKNSKPVETSNLMNYETTNLQQIRKRLELLYPDSHKLQIVIEEEVFSIRLEMSLNRSIV
jgi:hypothetical protein